MTGRNSPVRTRFSFAPVVTCILVLVILASDCSDNSKAEKIDGLLSYCHEEGMFNGTALVAEDGGSIYNKAFGFANRETGELLNTNSPFYLGSVSKQFTAMAIMILREQGKLGYDDELASYLPEFPSYAETVTIRHLLTHTSGIANYTDFNIKKPGLTNQDVLDFLVERKHLDFNPGEGYSYSNSGYVLLAMIVEKVSGMRFAEFLEQWIFGPLEMDLSFVYNEADPRINDRAVGYDMFGDKDDYNLLTYGPGGIFSTTRDLFKWDKALYTEALVKRETLAEAFTPYKLADGSFTDYGFGWAIKENDTGTTVRHAGGQAGYLTWIERQLSDRNTIILLTNNGSGTPIRAIANAVEGILGGKEYKLPPKPIAIELLDVINKENVDVAIDRYHELKRSHRDSYDFGDTQLNDLGYHLLQKNRIAEAIRIFKLNVEAFPDESNTYDSLGEAYMANKDYGLATKNYEESLARDPDNAHAVEMLRVLDQELNR
jgi:CubicO group peptidase (beta-lactamase class C family)